MQSEGFGPKWEADPRLRNLYRAQDEHQITFSFGNLSGETIYSPLNSEGGKADASSLVIRISYCFFIPQAKWLALGLGTSVGYEVRRDRALKLKEGESYHLPGLLVAANVRMAGNTQMIFGIDHSVERWENLGIDQRFSEPSVAAASPELVSVNLRLTDLFLTLLWRWEVSWGVTLEMHRRFARFFKPTDAVGKAVDVDIGHRDLWLGMGVTYLVH